MQEGIDKAFFSFFMTHFSHHGEEMSVRINDFENAVIETGGEQRPAHSTHDQGRHCFVQFKRMLKYYDKIA